METRLPTADGYTGIFILGLRHAGTNGTQTAGAIIMKRSFTVDGSGALTPDPAGEMILTGDSVLEDDRGTADTDDDTVQVLLETDLVPRKHQGDVVVLGHVGSDTGGRVRIDPGSGFVDWLTRPAAPIIAPDADIQSNLFGFHPRIDAVRKDRARPVFPDFDPTTESGNLDLFHNAHRRSTSGFVAVSRSHSDAGSVEVFQVPAGGTETFAFDYAFPILTARYHAYCGCGQDRAAYWGPVDLGAMTLDTLVIRPDQNTVSAVWRASWPWDQVPADAYRLLVVEEA